MQYLQPKFTVDVGKVNPEMCCERCVFGTGTHATWCDRWCCPECNAFLVTKTSGNASEGA